MFDYINQHLHYVRHSSNGYIQDGVKNTCYFNSATKEYIYKDSYKYILSKYLTSVFSTSQYGNQYTENYKLTDGGQIYQRIGFQTNRGSLYCFVCNVYLCTLDENGAIVSTVGGKRFCVSSSVFTSLHVHIETTGRRSFYTNGKTHTGTPYFYYANLSDVSLQHDGVGTYTLTSVTDPTQTMTIYKVYPRWETSSNDSIFTFAPVDNEPTAQTRRIGVEVYRDNKYNYYYNNGGTWDLIKQYNGGYVIGTGGGKAGWYFSATLPTKTTPAIFVKKMNDADGNETSYPDDTLTVSYSYSTSSGFEKNVYAANLETWL